MWDVLACLRSRQRIDISFAHSAYPTDCVSPNLISVEGLEDFPGFCGTGFFACKGNEVFYITARHCLAKQNDEDIGRLAARLQIPYTLSAETRTTDDYVPFNSVLSVKHSSEDIAGSFLDAVVLTIDRRRTTTAHYQLLRARAVRLPPNGQWLDRFVQHPAARADFEIGKGIRFSAIGYPHAGTLSKIEYPEDRPVEIITQAARIDGYLAKGTGPDRYMLNDVSWMEDLNGFSGSPIIVNFGRDGAPNYALAGMLVSGGSGRAQFIRIALIAEALKARKHERRSLCRVRLPKP